MQKYDFSIRTRDGLVIKRLTIAGRDQEQAERKLQQMYRHCEIVSCVPHHKETTAQAENAIMEDISSLLAK